jgi:hypothetical protein
LTERSRLLRWQLNLDYVGSQPAQWDAIPPPTEHACYVRSSFLSLFNEGICHLCRLQVTEIAGKLVQPLPED